MPSIWIFTNHLAEVWATADKIRQEIQACSDAKYETVGRGENVSDGNNAKKVNMGLFSVMESHHLVV